MSVLPITEYLVNNAKNFKDDVALVEINPEVEEKSRMTWREYSLIEPGNTNSVRKEMTWGEFDKKANRFCNLLLSTTDTPGWPRNRIPPPVR